MAPADQPTHEEEQDETEEEEYMQQEDVYAEVDEGFCPATNVER